MNLIIVYTFQPDIEGALTGMWETKQKHIPRNPKYIEKYLKRMISILCSNGLVFIEIAEVFHIVFQTRPFATLIFQGGRKSNQSNSPH